MTIQLSPSSRAEPNSGLGLGCPPCAFLGLCGGTFTDFDCMSACCHKPETCTLACPQADNFVRVLEDCGGLSSNQRWHIRQSSASPLPLYVPMIHHGYRRTTPLTWSTVALPSFAVTRIRATTGRIIASADELRQRFQLDPRSRVILVSVDADARLEYYWSKRHRHDIPNALANLGIEEITAPNFSFPINVPRTDHLTNRRRSLICSEELSKAGLSVIPHLNAVNQRDWDTWRDILREQKSVRYVCKEFQTGGSSRKIGIWHIRQLRELEQRLGRSLHLIAVGGARHLGLLAQLSAFTIIDSVPFMKTCFRRLWSFQRQNWMLKRTSTGEALNKMLMANVSRYSQLLELSRARFQQYELKLDSLDSDYAIAPPDPVRVHAATDGLQTELFPRNAEIRV